MKPPLHVYFGGFLTSGRIRRILELAGYDVRVGLPLRGRGQVGVWGRTPRARRGMWISRQRSGALVTVEDSFLRSVKSGRTGEAPVGLIIDRQGAYFDCSVASDLENILNRGDLSANGLHQRAAQALALYRHLGLSKYNAFSPKTPVPEPGFVLVIDQTRNDASVTFGGASGGTFKAMLRAARAENPTSEILIKTHPETRAGRRAGYFSATDEDARTQLLTDSISPAHLFERAAKVYVVTSLMGFEAILHGHRPRVFGKPFYGGWGVSEDEHPFERRDRHLTRTQLFAGAMLIYPAWYDVYTDRLCDFETAARGLAARSRAWREDNEGYDALDMRLWKRAPLRRFFRDAGPRLRFLRARKNIPKRGQRGLIWAGKETENTRADFRQSGKTLLRLEDGFLRSRGLGAELVEAMSLVVDDLGIYYDPTRESRLDRMLNASANLPDVALMRARNLREALVSEGVSKYNLGGDCACENWPNDRKKILVPGQVEDDASILKGAGKIARNIDLLRLARAENPEAFIVYKPHPDVEKNLRRGRIEEADARGHADMILKNGDPILATMAVDEVWTMTSLLGFEALLRGCAVVSAGTPFYAGWGLTRDLMGSVAHRTARPSLDALVHCALIDYPRYFDPLTGLACPVEVVLARLAAGETGPHRPVNRTLSRLQGLFASATPFWRR